MNQQKSLKRGQSKPKAVIINDIHFNVANLEIASSALETAAEKSYELGVPLIIAGDLIDTKAILRGEVANRLKELFDRMRGFSQPIFILVGNHDLINEKSPDTSLNFLSLFPEVNLIRTATYYDHKLGLWFLPYYHDLPELKRVLSRIDPGSIIIMHQGVQGAFMGHYVQDKTSLSKEDFADFRVISGHYHRKQDIKCGRPRKGGVGLFSYTGSPYTQSFSEAEDGPKGFHVLMDDGMLELVELPFRRHKIIEVNVDNLAFPMPAPDDIIWLKVRGPKSELDKIEKKDLVPLIGHASFKLDKIPLEAEEQKVQVIEKKDNSALFDSLIDNLAETEEHKEYLKLLWKGLLCT